MLCDPVIYREFVAYLSESPHEDEKKGGTIVEYLRKVIHAARGKFFRSGVPAHVDFFVNIADPAQVHLCTPQVVYR